MRSRAALLLVAIACAAPACNDSTGLTTSPDAGDGGDAGPRVDPSAPLFDPAHVVEVSIELAPADWDALRVQARTASDIFGSCLSGPFPDPFTWFKGKVTIDGESLDDVGVRKKGFLGSLDPNKPSIKLKFDEFVDRQKLAGLKGFTLNNAKQDPSYVHQCLAYETFTAAGLPATRCNFAHVKVNGADLGLYVHVESGSQDMLERHFADADGNLYEGTLSDFRDGWTATFELKTNEAKNDRSDLQPVVEALKAPDAELLARLEPLVDVDEFLTFWATEVLIAHWDGYTGNANNFYAYHDPQSGKFHFLPWGADATFVRVRPGGPGAPVSVVATTLLPRRLYLLPATRDRYVQRLRDLLAKTWNEDALRAEIDRMQRLIMPIADPTGARGVAARIDEVRAFVAGRRAAIEAELANGPPAWTAPLRNAPCAVPIGDVKGTFATTFGTTGVPDPLGTGRASLAGTVNGAALQVVRTGAVAGYDPKAMPPGSGPVQVIVVGLLADNTAAIVAFNVSPPRFRPSSDLTIDWGAVNGSLYSFNPRSMAFQLLGILSSGTIHLDAASLVNGAPVSGTFSATVAKPPW